MVVQPPGSLYKKRGAPIFVETPLGHSQIGGKQLFSLSKKKGLNRNLPLKIWKTCSKTFYREKYQKLANPRENMRIFPHSKGKVLFPLIKGKHPFPTPFETSENLSGVPIFLG